jgi:hypothetical protein
MSLYNPEQFGQNTITWMGQIVDDEEWKKNIPGKKHDTPDEVPGWGYRYKVRIFGKHPEKGLSDTELPFADVLYPITAGSGHGSSAQTPNLRKGNFVYGIYLDGKDQTQPLILGCFGNSDEIKLKFSKSQTGFVPISGLYSEQVPTYSIPAGGSGPKGGPSPKEGTNALGGNGGSNSDEQAEKDGYEETTLPISEKCAKSLSKTQVELKRFIKRIEETQKKTKNWSYWVNQKGSELASGKFKSDDGSIDIDIERAAKAISKEMKDVINGIREYITNEIDKKMTDIHGKLFPEEEKKVEEAHKKVVNTITCLFNKIISNLLKMIAALLREIIGRFINVPLCAAENVLSGLLGQLTGFITGALSSILGPLTSIVGVAIDLAGDILGFVAQILGLFVCDEESACPETTKWSLWGSGSPKPNIDVSGLFNKVKSIADSTQQITDPDNFDFNLDFSSVFDNPCNVGPIFCGPPIVEFYGGGGSGALGNAIISATGDILGVDIVASGFGYSRPPFVNFIDNCNRGKGASGRAVIANGGVVEVIMDNPGFGYVSSFDGNRGGDGRIYATPDQIIIKRSADQRYELFDQTDVFEVNDGDIVDGPYVLLNGTSEGLPASQLLTSQIQKSIFPTNSKGEYNIVLKICRVEINSPGVNYSSEDKIIVEPNNGAILEPVFGPFGSIIDVNIVNPGSGFTERPRVYIQTETGYNAELIPILCIDRIGDVPEDDVIPFGEKIIQVIDCVGKP